VEHGDAAQLASLVGALGAVLALVPRGRVAPVAGFVLLGLGTLGISRSLVGYADIHLLLTSPSGLGLVGVGVVAAVGGAVLLVRYPAVVPIVLLCAAPFRIPIRVGGQDAFLLLPLYLVLSSAILALVYRLVRGENPAAPPLFLSLPTAAFVAFTSVSFVWTWDTHEGGIILAFFVFPFVAGFGVLARTQLVDWLPRALVVTLAALATLFAVVGLWEAHSRTLVFRSDLQVANAYTTFFRVTSLFKDPSLYGRYLVVPMAVLLVVLLLRETRPLEWAGVAALVLFLFAGLYFSYSQSSFVALFVVTFGLAFLAADRRIRIALAACACVTLVAAAAFAVNEIHGRSVKDVTSSRSRLVTITLDAFRARPVGGVGIGGQPEASLDRTGTGSVTRNASHTAPLTVLAEGGIIGFALYAWMLGASGWALYLVTRRDRLLGVGLASVLLVLFVHSLLYAGFFEDPLTWGVLGIASAVLVAKPVERRSEAVEVDQAPDTPPLLAH
jgi:hypothetical protein